MKIMYLGIATWPSYEIAMKKMWIWLKSVDRFKYDFKYYGIGVKGFPGYRGQKVECQVDYLKKEGWGDATHILYTDCCDVLLLGPPSEIEEKYKAMGSPPILASANNQLGNVSDNRYDGVFDENCTYPYPCVGGYLMEAPLLLETLTTFQKKYPDYGDDCFMWYDGVKDGWFKPVMDGEAQIFQTRNEEQLEVVDGGGYLRFKNKVTGTLPCMIHMSGGYASHDNFKDDAMLPLAKKVGLL